MNAAPTQNRLASVDLEYLFYYWAKYLWLNRLQCVGVGVFDVAQSRVSYDIYAMR
jgi:hypothetical protein